MAKIKTIYPIASISGKLSQNSKTYTRTNKHTGRVSLVCVENPYNGPWSEAQTEHRKSFAMRSKTASQWLRTHSPKYNQGKASKEYIAMLRKYQAQIKIGNIFAFVAKHYRDGEILSFL